MTRIFMSDISGTSVRRSRMPVMFVVLFGRFEAVGREGVVDEDPAASHLLGRVGAVVDGGDAPLFVLVEEQLLVQLADLDLLARDRMSGAPQKPIKYVADICLDGYAPVRLTDDETLVQEVPQLPAQLQPGSLVGPPLTVTLDGVALFVHGLVELVEGDAVLE